MSMDAVKILIVEDDNLIAEDMAAKLTQTGYEISGLADSCDKALQSAKANAPDIVFLDIAIMGKKDGIETAKELKAINPNFLFIFLTNLQDEKTLQRALVVKPAGFLYKPFTQAQLRASILMAINNAAQNEGHDMPLIRDDYFFLKENEVFRKYHISDILYLEANQAYSYIYTKGGKRLLQSINMGKTHDKINHPDLIRVSRSYVVNINNIGGIKGNVILIGDKQITVTDQYKDDIFSRVQIVK